jgi:hypothetical protein
VTLEEEMLSELNPAENKSVTLTQLTKLFTNYILSEDKMRKTPFTVYCNLSVINSKIYIFFKYLCPNPNISLKNN